MSIQEEILDSEEITTGATTEGVVIDGETSQKEEKPTVIELAVKVESKVIATNLDKFKQQADDFLGSLTTKFETDEDFETAKEEIKLLKDVEDNTKNAIQAVINGNADIRVLIDAANEYIEKFRQERLSRDKMVKSKWQAQKDEVTNAGHTQVRTAMNAFSDDVKKALTIALNKDGNDIETQVNNAAKNKRTLASLQKSINAEVNGLIAEITQQGAIINEKLKLIEPEFKYLFADAHELALRDDFEQVVTNRMNTEAERLEMERLRKQNAEEEARQAVEQHAQAQEEQQKTQEQKRQDLRNSIESKFDKTLSADHQAADNSPAPDNHQEKLDTFAIYFTATKDEAVKLAKQLKETYQVIKLTKVNEG